MSATLPPALETTFDNPKQFLDLRKRLISCSATTKTQAAIGTISELVAPGFLMNSALLHLTLPDGYWLAPPHVKCSHKADARRDHANPFTVADALLHTTYDEHEVGSEGHSDSATAAAITSVGNDIVGGYTEGPPPDLTNAAFSTSSRKRVPNALLERAAKIRQDSDAVTLVRYEEAVRLIIAQIRYNLSEAANTTLGAMTTWNDALLDNDLVRAWHIFTEVALFKNSPKRQFTERLMHALWSSDEYKLSHCDCWATFASRWISARVLLQLSDPTIPDSQIIHHFAAALAGDPSYAEVMLRLRDDDDRYSTPVANLTLARNSLSHAIEYAEHAKLKSDTLFKARGPTVYFSSTIVSAPSAPKVLTLGNRPNATTPLCRFRDCRFGDACSKMHGEDDPRFVKGVIKPEYVARVNESLEASRRRYEQRRLKETKQAKDPLSQKSQTEK